MKNWQNVLSAPVILVGSHEPLSFRRRCGYAAVFERESFDHEHADAVIEGAAARGITWVRTHFFKGFGLEAEAEEIDLARDFTRRCHRRGLKVELYTQVGTLQYETFLAEEPRAVDWCSVNEDGKHTGISYGHQDFRYVPCLTRNGYWTYFKKVLDKGMDYVQGDGFGFDNVGGPGEPESCHCDACRKAFVEYLKAKYEVDTLAGRKRVKERFGLAVLDHVRPPTFNRWNPVVACRQVRNPVMQEWIAFRSDGYARRAAEIREHVKARKPEMLLEYNAYGDFGCNCAYFGGLELHKVLPHADAFWNERSPGAPEFVASSGMMHHRVHAYKLAEAYETVAFTIHQGRDARQRELAVSECLAFNQGHLAGFGHPADFAAGGFAQADRFIAFRAAHPELYDRAASAAAVGLVEHAPSRTNNSIDPHYAEVLAFGSLLAGHVPFDLVPEPAADSLRRYAVIVLPDVECMSDAEAGMYAQYVKGGGSLVFTDRTGWFDSWLRARQAPALMELLEQARGVEKFFAPRPLEPVSCAREGVLKGRFGKGRFAYLRRLQPVRPFQGGPDEWAIHTHYWQLAKNHEEFIGLLAWAREGQPGIEVAAPRGLAAEWTRAEDGRQVLHLVNYDLKKSAMGVHVSLRGQTVKNARIWSPWNDRERAAKVARRAGTSRIEVGPVPRYVVLEWT